ncbi:FtsX-like permease family protein [Mucilaginibacter limnophilus]|uniref:FtsX-like permease family protein n=1 Tax=Mucilaginibacter limnophilus TaxID=1932778 RepID=A0A3S2Y4N3_9SPHI|nr:ABC transporter permease [Mucilaginibacter limnophilus]RVU01948.1 FtsX-like permease family protein [Mucilaginibacter limnophilus]
MIKNYLLIALRNIRKNTVFSFINILGLAIGMAACLLIIQYVIYELSYDDFQTKKERIYRVHQDRYDQGKLSTRWAAGAFAAGNAFKNAFPEIEDFVKVVSDRPALAKQDDRKLKIEKVAYASPAFFKVFSYQLLSGDAGTALTEPNSIVISETTAKNLFGTIDVTDKSLMLDNERLFKITGVFKDFPKNTHLKLDMIKSYSTFTKDNGDYDVDNAWYNDGCLTYLLLKPGTNIKALEAKFPPLVKKAYDNPNISAVYTLMPLTDIHLYSHLMMEAEPNGDGNSVYLLLGIAIFVIVIAWINYINLATARGISRAREVGVRKTLGSAKSQLVTQFMLEAAVLNGLAVLLAVIIIGLFLPAFSKISGQDISLTLLINPWFWAAVTGIFVAGTFFSGFYPALVLSGFKVVSVIKGKLTSSPKGIVLRQGMVVFQFAASIFLLIGSLTVYRQIQYMQQQKLGVNIDQTLVIKAPLAKVDSFYRSMSTFKQESLKQPGVKSITVSTTIPGQPVNWNAGGIKLVGADNKDAQQYRVIGADEDYLEAYGLKMISGRKFSKKYTNENKNVVFNKSAVKLLGLNSPAEAIGKRIEFWGETYTIIGVTEDFHQQSLKETFDAQIFRCIPDVRGDVSVKVNQAQVTQAIAALKQNWKEFFPDDQFDYFFLDEHFNQQYKADQRFGQVFGLFTIIAIFVACLGLFGLVSFTIVQRTKEIGIRKVLGASVNNILQLLYKDFALLILIAFVISAPLGWYAINQWLQGYAFRIGISWVLFAVPFVVVALIAMATVSLLTVKAAFMNPVKSLKVE